MAEQIEKTLPDFKKFGRKRKLCMNPELLEDLGWTLDKDSPDLTIFRDTVKKNDICTQEGVNNTLKGVTHNKQPVNSNKPVHSVTTAQETDLKTQKL